MKIIIAGNRSQFLYWCRENEVDPKSVHYIDREEKLMGVRNAEVVTYGTYYQRPDWPEIEARLVQMKWHGDLMENKK